jgi:4-amino-4-deoxy-L-arabinose transferase-like glycosyltransferase
VRRWVGDPTRSAGVLIAAAYLGLTLHGLGGADVVGDDEAREAGIVQAILAGDWLFPRFNGLLVPDKPILAHWVSALACLPAGFSEAAIRLPSALAAAGVVALTARVGATFASPAVGAAAAALLATTPAFFARARVARPDALLALVLVLALLAFWRWWRDRAPGDATLTLALVGASVLVKGPVAPALFAATAGTFLLWQGDLRRRLPGLFTPLGVFLGLVLGLGWYALALGGWGPAFVEQHLLGRYVYNLAGRLPEGGAWSGRSLPYHLSFYPLHLPLVALPWTPLAAVGVWWAWRADRLRDPRVRFLLCWIAAPILVFTAAQYKLRYYLLPTLPAVAVLGGMVAVRPWGARRPAAAVVVSLRSRRAAVAAGAVVVAIAGAWLAFARPDVLSTSDRRTLEALATTVPGGATGAAVLVGFAVGVLAMLVALDARRAAIGVVAGAAAAWMGFGVPALERATTAHDSIRPFAARVAALVPAGGRVVFVGEPVRSLVVYLSGRLPGGRLPAVRRREPLPAGGFVVARDADHRALLGERRVGPPLAAGEGRLGNLGRGWLVLAQSTNGGRP